MMGGHPEQAFTMLAVHLLSLTVSVALSKYAHTPFSKSANIIGVILLVGTFGKRGGPLGTLMIPEGSVVDAYIL